MLIEIFTQQIALTITTSVLTGVIGYLVATLRKRTKIEKAMFKIARSNARREIVDAYEEYVVQKRKMTVERYNELSETYEAYLELGGNGTAKRLMQEINEIKPWIVLD